jgi:predicted RNase H-like nuclease
MSRAHMDRPSTLGNSVEPLPTRLRDAEERLAIQGMLADIERQDAEQALTQIDEALILAQETGEHWTDSFLHRVRGEILLKRDPANTASSK